MSMAEIEDIIQDQVDHNSELYLQMQVNHCMEELREAQFRLFYTPISEYA